MLLGSHGLSPRRNFNYLGNDAAEADNKFWPVPLELSGRVMQLQTLRLAVISQSQKSAYNHMTFLR